MCSVQDLLIETTKEGGIVGGPILHQSDQGKDPPFAAATRRSLYNGDTDESCTLEPETQEDTTTSRQYHCYPSPASDNFLDDGQTVPSKKDDVTLSIVHYRPDGIPNGKFRGQSASSIRKSRKPRTPKVNSSPGGLEIRMVKWDRITDKGTAPLNVEPRQTVPRACTLCSLSKRKCGRTDGKRPNQTHPCAACQEYNFVCQFISPSQLRDGTTQAPTLESLKLHTDQAQRLRTMELENKVVTLEHALKMQMMENRVLSGYIANSKVYEAIVNRYILELKETLQRFDPGSGLLEFHIPTMPEKGQYTTDPEAERLCERDLTLSEIIDGMPVLQNMDIELSNDS